MLPRALIAAALALLIGGDCARLGWDAFRLGHFLFPYLWLFLMIEFLRARRRIEDEELFFIGAALAVAYSGVYTKELQSGLHPYGIDWLAIPETAFDGGMTAVLSARAAGLWKPRVIGEIKQADRFIPAFLILCLMAASVIYGVNTAFNVYSAQRLLSATWLVADILLMGAAWALARRAFIRSGGVVDDGRKSWIL